MAAMATDSLSGGSQTLKMTGHEINDLVDQEVSCAMEDGDLKDRVRTAIYEVFCAKDNFMINSSTLKELKQLALANLQGEGVPDKTCQRVLAMYDNVFKEHSLPPASKAQQGKMMKMWHNLIDTYSPEAEFDDGDLSDVDVELSSDRMELVMKEHGCLQLRRINPDADTLILGCGNGRNVDGGSYAFSHVSEDSYNSEYSLKHNHPVSAVTIDPDIHANPTIVAFFGDQSVSKLFQGKKFKKIIFEGYFSPGQQRYRRSDIEALLAAGGKVYIDQGAGPVPLSDAGFQL